MGSMLKPRGVPKNAPISETGTVEQTSLIWNLDFQTRHEPKREFHKHVLLLTSTNKTIILMDIFMLQNTYRF